MDDKLREYGRSKGLDEDQLDWIEERAGEQAARHRYTRWNWLLGILIWGTVIVVLLQGVLELR